MYVQFPYCKNVVVKNFSYIKNKNDRNGVYFSGLDHFWAYLILRKKNLTHTKKFLKAFRSIYLNILRKNYPI